MIEYSFTDEKIKQIILSAILTSFLNYLKAGSCIETLNKIYHLQILKRGLPLNEGNPLLYDCIYIAVTSS